MSVFIFQIVQNHDHGIIVYQSVDMGIVSSGIVFMIFISHFGKKPVFIDTDQYPFFGINFESGQDTPKIFYGLTVDESVFLDIILSP